MAYKVHRATEVTRDLYRIEDFLIQTYRDLGEGDEGAAIRAEARIEDALVYMRSFVSHPHRGTEQPKIRTGLRSVTHNRFIYYFEIDEARSEVMILAIFFGGMDHRSQIVSRLS